VTGVRTHCHEPQQTGFPVQWLLYQVTQTYLIRDITHCHEAQQRDNQLPQLLPAKSQGHKDVGGGGGPSGGGCREGGVRHNSEASVCAEGQLSTTESMDFKEPVA
jgi:hypothetical protein